MPVRIVTDSSSDLPPEDAERLGVEVVPLSIRFGTDEYTDGVDLSVGEFYDKLATSADLPETAAPSPGAFEAAFRRQAEAGADQVVCINLSSGLSATIQSAQNAARAVGDDLDVRVVDSRTITAGLGTLVTVAAEWRPAGPAPTTSSPLVESMVGADPCDRRPRHARQPQEGRPHRRRPGPARLAAVDQAAARHLHRRGRGGGQARTRRKALEWLRDRIFERPRSSTCASPTAWRPTWSRCWPCSPPVRDPATRIRTLIGPTIGTHGGPRVMGLTWVDPA